MKNNKPSLLRAVFAAFPKTIPIFTGFLFLGMSYGIFAKSQGIPELLTLSVVVILHLLRRQMLLSIGVGTIFYMFLLQFIF